MKSTKFKIEAKKILILVYLKLCQVQRWTAVWCEGAQLIRFKIFRKRRPHLCHRTATPHCKEDPIYVFPEMKLRGFVPNFHAIYIPTIFPYFRSKIGRPIVGIYKSLRETYECGNWERGSAVSFLGIFFSIFWYSVFAEHYAVSSPEAEADREHVSSLHWRLLGRYLSDILAELDVRQLLTTHWRSNRSNLSRYKVP